MQRLLYLFLFILLFFLLIEISNLILCGLLDKLNLRIISIGDILLMISLTVENTINILQHFL